MKDEDKADGSKAVFFYVLELDVKQVCRRILVKWDLLIRLGGIRPHEEISKVKLGIDF